MTGLIFFLAVLALLYFTPFKRPSSGAGCTIAAVFIISMEVFWGALVHDHSYLGVFISCLMVSSFFLLFYLVIKSRVITTVVATTSITSAAIYFTSFDIYFQIFNDFPTLSMYRDMHEAFTVLDSVLALINSNHLLTLLFGLVSVVMTVRNFKTQKQIY